MNGLLAGLRVVELGSGLPGSIVSMLLAEQGAEVVRITLPEDRPVDPVLHAVVGRGKVDTTLDLEQVEDRKTLDQLLARADVAIQTKGCFGAAQGDLDFEKLRAEVNSDLIGCTLSPFPLDDPRNELPGHEAITGLAGFIYNKPLGKPFLHEFAVGSVTSALYSASGIMAALISRHRFGGGQDVATSMFDANLTSQVLQILVKAGVPRGFLPLRMVGSPFMRVWECGGGRYVYLHITMPKHNSRMLEILDESGFSEEVAELRRLMSDQTIRDPSQVGSIAEAKKLKAVYEKVFIKRTADEWEQILGFDLCCIKVRTIEEWLKDSVEAGMSDACLVEDPVFGELLGPGPVVTPPDSVPTVLPRRTDPEAFLELRGRWNETPREPSSTHEGDGEVHRPLEGIRVVDLSRIIAGPCSARILAELGAEVLSIQSETALDWALSFHLVFNAGKKSATLDFTDEDGKEKLWAVLDKFQPHVFVQNYRHLDLANAIGVGPEAVRARFPQIVYTYLNAYGNRGVWKERPGFEQVVQAVSGIQVSYARGARPKLLPSPIIDIGCGLFGSFGTLMGLYREMTTGEPATVTTHLTSMSVLLQLPQVSAFQRANCLERASQGGHDIEYDPNREVVTALLKVKGGYACAAGPRGDMLKWLRHTGLHDQLFEGTAIEDLTKRFSKAPLSAALSSVEAAGLADTIGIISNPKIRNVVEYIAEYDKRPLPIIRRQDYPGSPQPMIFIGNPIRLSTTPLIEVPATPLRGTHTSEVLSWAGEELPDGAGVIPYPPDKPFLIWFLSFIRWGYFAWKSGNI